MKAPPCTPASASRARSRPTNTRAYVTNRNTGTVTVYDTINEHRRRHLSGRWRARRYRRQAATAPGSTCRVRRATRSPSSTPPRGVEKATIAVANPTAITINPAGSVVYVANGSAATVIKISTSTNTIAGTVKLIAGVTPTEVRRERRRHADLRRQRQSRRRRPDLVVLLRPRPRPPTIVDTAFAPTGRGVNSATYEACMSADADGGLTVVQHRAQRTCGAR